MDAIVISPKDEREAWEMLSVEDRREVARWSRLSREILELGVASDDPELSTLCRARLAKEAYQRPQTWRHYTPPRDETIHGQSSVAVEFEDLREKEGVSTDTRAYFDDRPLPSRLIARVFFPDAYERPREEETPTGVDVALNAERPQSTFVEVRELNHAVADARTMTNWKEDLFGWIYQSPRWPEAEISIDDREYVPAATALSTLQARLSGQAKVAFELIIRELIEAGGETAIRVDCTDLAEKVYGRDAVDGAERARTARRQLWNDLEFVSRIKVRAKRPGKYRLRGRKRDSIDIVSDTMLFRIPIMTVLANDPADRLSIVIEPASFIRQYAGQRHILADFGSLTAIAAIQPGRTPGKIARSVGATLQQLWREEASRTPVGENGDNHRSVARFKKFTRRDLLLGKRAFRCELDIEEYLYSKDSKRIVKHWDSAIALLKRENIIGFYKATEIDLSGHRWRDRWLDQPLDIRPGGEGARDAVTLAKTVEKRKAARKRSAQRKAKDTTQKPGE